VFISSLLSQIATSEARKYAMKILANYIKMQICFNETTLT